MEFYKRLTLKNPEKLDEEKDEKQRLEKAINPAEPLAKANYLKDSLIQFQ